MCSVREVITVVTLVKRRPHANDLLPWKTSALIRLRRWRVDKVGVSAWTNDRVSTCVRTLLYLCIMTSGSIEFSVWGTVEARALGIIDECPATVSNVLLDIDSEFTSVPNVL